MPRFIYGQIRIIPNNSIECGEIILIVKGQQHRIEEELGTLTKKIKQIALNYDALNDKRPREFRSKDKWKNEKGQNKQKVPKKGSEDKVNVSNYIENIPYEVGEGWEEDEFYMVRENRYQPYAGNSKKVAQGRPESQWKNREAPEPGQDDETEEGKDDPFLISKEKEWLLSLAELEYKDHRDKTLKENLTANANKEMESGEETTEEYYKCEKADAPNLDTLYSVKTPKWGESIVGVEFSNNDSDWDNNLPCRAKMWLGSGGTDKEGGSEDHIPKDVLKRLKEY
ncbi:31425_t:CDS:2 [Gigaspora margarita]|uniref:31425_t:CDS:1 n=1 Tax=Gigaspora margarita TaxID=4874 RepID=A0ABM8VWJ2_GIGMA|nr:31425_t:CDS:2 [Gigaspora margarita]